MAQFTVLGNPHVGDASNTSFHSQISCVFKVEGKKDLYIACADRWLPELQHLEYEVYGRLFREHFDPNHHSDNAMKEMAAYLKGHSFRNTSIADYVWLPLRFDGEMVYIDWHDKWKIEDYE